MIPLVPGSICRFPLLIIHIGPSLFKENIECLRWFNANEFSELHAREESPLEQVSLHVIDARDLNGLAVELINKLHEGFVASLDDSLKGGLNLRVSTRHFKGVDQLLLRVPPESDRPWGEIFIQVHRNFHQGRREQPTLDWSLDVIIVEHCFEPLDVVDWVNNGIILLQLKRLLHSFRNDHLHDGL